MLLMVFTAGDVLKGDALEQLQKITSGIEEMPEVREVISLYATRHISGDSGVMTVSPAVPFIPATASETDSLRRIIKSNPLAWPLLISEDFRHSLILVSPAEGVTDEALFGKLNALLAETRGPGTVMMGGMPYLRHEILRSAIRDLLILLPAGFLLMILFLYLSFRELKGVLLPLAVVAMAVVVALGLMPLLGFDLSLIAVLTPILMIAIANNYGVHILARYQELNARHPSWSMQRIVKESREKLFNPILLTALTTIAGILGMVVHIMLPARQMGLVSSVGIAFALVLSLNFLPAILSRLKKGKPQKSYLLKKHDFTDKCLHWCSEMATRRPKTVMVVGLLTAILLGSGIFYLRVNINNEEMMPAKHPVNQTARIINTHFGGTRFVSVLIRGDVKSPEVMKEMDHLEQKLHHIKGVGQVTSLAKVMRIMSTALNNPGDSLYDKIPGTREAIAQYLELYQMSGDPEDFEALVDFNYEHALVNVQFSATTLKEFDRVMEDILQAVKESPHAILTSGLCRVEHEMAVSIAQGQIYSLIFALVVIALLLWAIFKAPASGLLGSVPLVFALLCNFGLMGWVGFRLDIATSLLSSIAIGLGVDYTIHLFWRLKQQLALGEGWEQAMKTTLSTTGRGITINAFSVMIGFSVLFISNLIILKSFAFLIIFSLLLCLLCAILLIPAFCITFKPKFLKERRR
ncbi:MAG TPA: MMPL family transporter [Bacteroidales bacterium]|nr:MMPL family transporter [Bacteroidales bacterium]